LTSGSTLTDAVPAVATVSDYYKLGRTQAGLEFVDVVLDGDTKLFVDPRAFRLIRTEWSESCADLKAYFSAVLDAIHHDDEQRARMLLLGLNEPNETHLGLSKGGRARGRGVGRVLADDLYDSLSESEARKSGLLQDLEDTALMVEGIGADRISDITTNVIRPLLIDYTQQVCRRYEIPMEQVESGQLWNPTSEEWETRFVDQPTPDGERLLLVPKAVVRYRLDFDPGDYYRKHILSFLASQEIARKSGLVQLLKDGTPKVYKKDLRKKYEKRKNPKQIIVEVTRDHPELLEEFRAAKQNDFSKPLELNVLAAKANTAPPNWSKMLKAVTDLKAGSDDATNFHDAVEELLSALFYPSLVEPVKEKEIETGIKRIDIRYLNMASDGFFLWFQKQMAKAPYVPVECKNYKEDPKNPELAQLVGRLNDNRGRLGILVCRKIEDRNAFIKRCHYELTNNGNYIVGLDDDDLRALVAARKLGDEKKVFQTIRKRLDEVLDS
jgi:hypothetical protein